MGGHTRGELQDNLKRWEDIPEVSCRTYSRWEDIPEVSCRIASINGRT
jgi:hypothetical protein